MEWRDSGGLWPQVLLFGVQAFGYGIHDSPSRFKNNRKGANGAFGRSCLSCGESK